MGTRLLAIGLAVSVMSAAAALLAWTEERLDARDLREEADERSADVRALKRQVEALELRTDEGQAAAGEAIEAATTAAETCEQSARDTRNFLEAALDAGAAVSARHVDLADATALACGDVRSALGDIPGG